MLKFDEAKNFLDARDDFVLARPSSVKSVGNVVGDRQRIEQRAFLKNKADLAAEVKKIMLAHGGNAVAENFDLAAVGRKETGGHFESESFAGASLTEEHEGLASLGSKRDTAENVAIVEADVHI